MKRINRETIKRLIKFFGCTQAAWWLDLCIYTLLFQVMKRDAILSKGISYTCGAILSYTLNRRFTFKDNNSISATLPRFIVINLLALGASLTSMHIFGNLLGLHMWICYFLSIVFSFSVNYLGNRFWVFKGEKEEE